MTIELTPELQQLVEEQVKTGRFTSTSEIVQEAVERFLLQEEDAKLNELRALIDEGLSDLDAGRFSELTAEDIIAQCHREHDANSKR